MTLQSHAPECNEIISPALITLPANGNQSLALINSPTQETRVAAFIARRHRLSLPVARLTCELALIGGEA